MIKEYIAYLKDNPKGYWFKAKMYGWGWVPATWQGWTVSFVWIIFFCLIMLTMNHEWFRSLASSTFLIIALLFICYRKGEKLQWRWGKEKRN